MTAGDRSFPPVLARTWHGCALAWRNYESLGSPVIPTGELPTSLRLSFLARYHRRRAPAQGCHVALTKSRTASVATSAEWAFRALRYKSVRNLGNAASIAAVSRASSAASNSSSVPWSAAFSARVIALRAFALARRRSLVWLPNNVIAAPTAPPPKAVSNVDGQSVPALPMLVTVAAPECPPLGLRRDSPRAYRAWPPAWPSPSGPLGWQRSPALKGGSRRSFLRSGFRNDLRVPLTLEGPARTMRGVPARSL